MELAIVIGCFILSCFIVRLFSRLFMKIVGASMMSFNPKYRFGVIVVLTGVFSAIILDFMGMLG